MVQIPLAYPPFRYRTVVNWLDVNFDNLSISRKIPAAIAAAPASSQLRYYPNPVRQNLYVASPQPVQELRLYDLGGRLVARQEGAEHLDLQQVAPAAYILQVLLRDGTSVYTRIAKE